MAGRSAKLKLTKALEQRLWDVVDDAAVLEHAEVLAHEEIT